MRAWLPATCAVLAPLVVHSAETLPLGGADRTRFLTFDAPTGRLYVAHDSEVTVVETAPLRVAAHVATPGPARAIAVAPNGHFYVTIGRAATVTVFDTVTNAVLATLPAGRDTNAIAYDPVSRRVFAMNDDDGTVTVIDTVGDKAVATIALPGGEGLESAAADGQGSLYVSHSAQGELVRIDTRRAAVDQHYPLPDCPNPAGVALDPADHRAFVSCLKGLLVVLDTQTGQRVATVPVGLGGRTVIYDGRRKRLFIANADATLSVIEADTPNRYRLLPPLQTLANARTVAEDPASGRLYLAGGATLMVVEP